MKNQGPISKLQDAQPQNKTLKSRFPGLQMILEVTKSLDLSQPYFLQ